MRDATMMGAMVITSDGRDNEKVVVTPSGVRKPNRMSDNTAITASVMGSPQCLAVAMTRVREESGPTALSGVMAVIPPPPSHSWAQAIGTGTLRAVAPR